MQIKLKGIIPDEVIANLLLPEIQTTYQINTRLRMAHFVSQMMHESGNFKAIQENLNYSADRLLVVFPKYFKTLEEAKKYERNPQKIASRTYASRYGNGDELSGDGYKYRGGGYLQTTFRENYKKAGTNLGVDFEKNPDLLRTPKYALLSAAYFWHSNGLNKLADGGATTENITIVRKKVNGGDKGLSDVIAKFNQVYPLIV